MWQLHPFLSRPRPLCRKWRLFFTSREAAEASFFLKPVPGVFWPCLEKRRGLGSLEKGLRSQARRQDPLGQYLTSASLDEVGDLCVVGCCPGGQEAHGGTRQWPIEAGGWVEHPGPVGERKGQRCSGLSGACPPISEALGPAGPTSGFDLRRAGFYSFVDSGGNP